MAANYYLNLNFHLDCWSRKLCSKITRVNLLDWQAGDEFPPMSSRSERFQSPVYNLAYRLLNDQPDVPATSPRRSFSRSSATSTAFAATAGLRTWVYRIAVNESHNRRRWLFRHCRR